MHVKPADLWADLERVLWYHDEPVHSPAALVGFHVFRVAAECGVRVMLSGQGADETIGGYPYFFVHHWYTLLRAGKTEECWREINAYCQHSAENATALYRRALRHFAQTEMSRVSAYRHAARWRQARELRGNAWFTDEITQQLQSADARRREDRKLQSALKQAVEVAPLPLYLRVEDRNSMAHSVEARLPFLDYRLVSLVFQLSDRWKLRGPWSKFVLREAVKGKIPEEVRARGDKMGFPVPAAQWFRNELYTPLQDMLASQAVRERGIYNVDAIRKGLDLHRDGWIDASNGLFNVAQLEELVRAPAERDGHSGGRRRAVPCRSLEHRGRRDVPTGRADSTPPRAAVGGASFTASVSASFTARFAWPPAAAPRRPLAAQPFRARRPPRSLRRMATRPPRSGARS